MNEIIHTDEIDNMVYDIAPQHLMFKTSIDNAFKIKDIVNKHSKKVNNKKWIKFLHKVNK